MIYGDPKYRGKPIFCEVRNRLMEVARGEGTINYGEIAEMMGLPTSGNHMATETGRMLGEICDLENDDDRPMLSAVVVTVDNHIPGEGFFTCAEQLGRTVGDKQTFWKNELQKVYSGVKGAK